MAVKVLLKGLIVGVFRHLSLLLAFCCVAQAAVASAYGAPTYKGMVVDAETKAPIEGAVVVVVWYKKPLITMNGPLYFHNAKEVLTDSKGGFSLSAFPGINWNPFTRLMKDPNISRTYPDDPGIYPVIAIFSPGYGPFPEAQVKPPSEVETKRAMLKEGIVVELPKLETKEELQKYTNSDDIGFSICHSTSRFYCVPADRIANFIRLLNVHRGMIGLDPLRWVSGRH